MKSAFLLLLVSTSIVWADLTNVTVRVAGRLQSATEIEQLVVAQARQAQMLFDFAGVRPHFTVLSNSTDVISMWCTHTNGSYFYATVDSRGGVQAQELTARDTEAIRAVLTRETTNTITQVWLGPDGRVGATTIESGTQKGEFFWLRRIRAKWMIYDRGTWNTSPPSPAVPAPKIYTR
jgi:hypothetical protein